MHGHATLSRQQGAPCPAPRLPPPLSLGCGTMASITAAICAAPAARLGARRAQRPQTARRAMLRVAASAAVKFDYDNKVFEKELVE